MEEQTFVIKFENVSVGDANIYAEDLRRDMMDVDPSVRVERRRDDPSSQDFGATLVLVLGTPAVIALAVAVKKWLIRNNAATITIEKGDGKLIARNLESKDAATVIEAFSHSLKA